MSRLAQDAARVAAVIRICVWASMVRFARIDDASVGTLCAADLGRLPVHQR